VWGAPLAGKRAGSGYCRESPLPAPTKMSASTTLQCYHQGAAVAYVRSCENRRHNHQRAGVKSDNVGSKEGQRSTSQIISGRKFEPMQFAWRLDLRKVSLEVIVRDNLQRWLRLAVALANDRKDHRY
jgi:hypothetical protein